MNRLALGTVQFGMPYGALDRQVDIEQAAKILGFALDSGFDTIDTAIAYGSEEVLGEIGVDEWVVITKLPATPHENIPEWIEKSINQSLKRLNIKKLEGVLLHSTSQLTSDIGERIYSALQGLKDKGKVNKIGISIYAPKELDELTKYQFDIVQAPLSVVDRRLITSGWLSRLHESNTEVHVRSVFLQGLLLRPCRPKKFKRWDKLWDCWDDWLTQTGFSAVQACLSFALSHKEIHRVIVGVDSLRQLQEIVSTSKFQVTNIPDELSSNDPDLTNPSRW